MLWDFFPVFFFYRVKTKGMCGRVHWISTLKLVIVISHCSLSWAEKVKGSSMPVIWGPHLLFEDHKTSVTHQFYTFCFSLVGCKLFLGVNEAFSGLKVTLLPGFQCAFQPAGISMKPPGDWQLPCFPSVDRFIKHLAEGCERCMGTLLVSMWGLQRWRKDSSALGSFGVSHWDVDGAYGIFMA